MDYPSPAGELAGKSLMSPVSPWQLLPWIRGLALARPGSGGRSGELALVQHFRADKALPQLPVSVCGEPRRVLHGVWAAVEQLSVICAIDRDGWYYYPLSQICKPRPKSLRHLPRVTWQMETEPVLAPAPSGTLPWG